MSKYFCCHIRLDGLFRVIFGQMRFYYIDGNNSVVTVYIHNIFLSQWHSTLQWLDHTTAVGCTVYHVNLA